MPKAKPIEIDKTAADLAAAKQQIQQLVDSIPLTLTLTIHRMTGRMTMNGNAADPGDIDRLIGGCEVALRELRAQQLKAAEERGKQEATPPSKQ